MKDFSTPKVSIITCFYNVENFLEETIKSVLNQTYENWEMILIDDGSTDDSTRIAKAYATNYPGKILYAQHPNHQNKGQSASRNKGVEVSTGELIAILDSDDIWLPEMLEGQVNIIQHYQVAMVCQASTYWYSWEQSNIKDVVIPVGAKQDQVYFPPQLLFELYPLRDGAAPCPSGWLLRKDAFLKHGGFENTFRGVYDDQIVLVKFYIHETVYVSSRCDNLYRQRSGSLMAERQKGLRFFSERKKFMDWFNWYLKDIKMNDPEVRSLFNQQYKQYSFPYYHLLMVKGRIKNLLLPSSLNKVK
jgi:glycosyltransferase involved in cell wall biosynthesis